MLNGRRSLDPRWITNHRHVPEGFMVHDVVLYRMEGDEVSMDPETGEVTGGNLVALWEGKARIQPNKDWRARFVESANDPQMVHYTRVQIPLSKNGPVPNIRVNDILASQQMEDTEDWKYNHTLESWTLFVRNAQNSSNRWLYNLLCAADLSDQEMGGS